MLSGSGRHFSRSGGSEPCRGEHDGQPDGHQPVGEQKPASVPLHVVFHIPGQTESAQEQDPGQNVSPLCRTGADAPDREKDHHRGQHRERQDLLHADESVAAQEQRVISGGIEQDLTFAVEREKQQESAALFPLPQLGLPAGEPDRTCRQHQKEEQRPQALRAEGREAPLRFSGSVRRVDAADQGG